MTEKLMHTCLHPSLREGRAQSDYPALNTPIVAAVACGNPVTSKMDCKIPTFQHMNTSIY